MTLAKARELDRLINYDGNFSFIVLATVITVVNCNRKTLIVQASVYPRLLSEGRGRRVL
jgi:hypothetical protein